MPDFKIFTKTDVIFADDAAALAHIGQEMVAVGVVKNSFPQALLEREKVFPTGIAFQRHAVAIPHSDAEHALSPAIYVIRPDRPVIFNQADEDAKVAAKLIVGLIVTDPKDQLSLLKRLFGILKENERLETLLYCKPEELKTTFQQMLEA